MPEESNVEFDDMLKEISGGESEQGDVSFDAITDENSGADGQTAAPARRIIEFKSGNIPEAELDELRPVCESADKKHQQVLEHVREIRAAEKTLQNFSARKGNVTQQDVEQAKQNFHKAKQSYIQLGNEINEGIKQIHPLAQMYHEDLLLQSLYSVYMAKLLSSLETRSNVEPFVEANSLAIFNFARHEITVDEGEELKGITVEKKVAQLLEDTLRTVSRLETRYQKRQLHNKIRKGMPKKRVINRLRHFLTLDPDDLHTIIWLAQLMFEEHERERNQNKRVDLRDDILNYCKRAFSKIDDFLDLQGIQTLSERDKRRSEYIKTITAIRKPLVG